MNQQDENGGEANDDSKRDWSAGVAPLLDAQHTELIETVWACERVWRLEDRMNAAIKFTRRIQ